MLDMCSKHFSTTPTSMPMPPRNLEGLGTIPHKSKADIILTAAEATVVRFRI